MNLYQMLTHIPHERLQRIADSFGVGVYSPSKRNLLQSIGARYRDVEFLAELTAELPHSHRGLLRALVFFTPPEHETIELGADLAAPWVEPEHLPGAVEEIAALGLIFPDDFRRNGRVILPHELRKSLLDVFRGQFKALTPRPGPASPMPPQRHIALEAVFHLLCVLLHVRVRQTQKGALHKRIFELWTQRIGEGLASESRFQFALDFVVHAGLARVEESELELTDEAARWLGHGEYENRRELIRFIVSSRVSRSREMQRLLALFASVEGENPPASGELYAVDDLLAELELNAWPEESDPVPREALIERLRWLDAAGVISLDDRERPALAALTGWGRRWLSLEETVFIEPEPAAPAMIQPNFELLAPPGASYDLLWRLDQIAEFRRRDVMTEYHLSQGALLKSMRRGWTLDAVLAFLDELSGGRVPDLVRFSLEEWGARYGRIRFRRVVLVECDGPELAEEITHLPDANGALEERISGACFAVSEREARRLFKLFRERGYEPSHDNVFTDSSRKKT
ncbi:MAG: hypothetical protein GC154_08740 [bacterium]|nr:hypothetical protein [bacterium]